MTDPPSPNEKTPLLFHDVETPLRQTTPLPKFQIAILLLLQICEPLTSLSIYPYINEWIVDLNVTGGDDKKVGYYAGLIESVFFATEAMTVLKWSTMSDYIGRKPVLLIGLFGTMLSMTSFGLSRTFLALVFSRCLTGLLNGNIGVMKTVMGELTDTTNRAQGFALVPVMWGIGGTIGPLLGGSFSRPHERFPNFFRGKFWKEYPYSLPCFATSTWVLFSFILTLFCFKETAPPHYQESVDNEDQPVPLRELRVYPVVISISNYVLLVFLNIAFYSLFPLFLAMPLEIGGLGFDPPNIGYIIGLIGFVGGLFQAFCFAPIVCYFGERKVFITAAAMFLPIFLSIPVTNMAAILFGKQSPVVWLVMSVLFVCIVLSDLAWGTIFIYITASAPNRRSLGATNGLSQTTASMARAIGPALSTSLFSFCVQRNILHGYGVYAFFAAFAILPLYLSTRLPSQVWNEADRRSP